MSARYKTITVVLPDESQHYVAEDRVTEQQIRSGDDDGVVCLAMDGEKAETIARLLNNYGSAGGRL
jgi:hypothetical protein